MKRTLTRMELSDANPENKPTANTVEQLKGLAPPVLKGKRRKLTKETPQDTPTQDTPTLSYTRKEMLETEYAIIDSAIAERIEYLEYVKSIWKKQIENKVDAILEYKKHVEEEEKIRKQRVANEYKRKLERKPKEKFSSPLDKKFDFLGQTGLPVEELWFQIYDAGFNTRAYYSPKKNKILNRETKTWRFIDLVNFSITCKHALHMFRVYWWSSVKKAIIADDGKRILNELKPSKYKLEFASEEERKKLNDKTENEAKTGALNLIFLKKNAVTASTTFSKKTKSDGQEEKAIPRRSWFEEDKRVVCLKCKCLGVYCRDMPNHLGYEPRLSRYKSAKGVYKSSISLRTAKASAARQKAQRLMKERECRWPPIRTFIWPPEKITPDLIRYNNNTRDYSRILTCYNLEKIQKRKEEEEEKNATGIEKVPLHTEFMKTKLDK